MSLRSAGLYLLSHLIDPLLCIIAERSDNLSLGVPFSNRGVQKHKCGTNLAEGREALHNICQVFVYVFGHNTLQGSFKVYS